MDHRIRMLKPRTELMQLKDGASLDNSFKPGFHEYYAARPRSLEQFCFFNVFCNFECVSFSHIGSSKLNQYCVSGSLPEDLRSHWSMKIMMNRVLTTILTAIAYNSPSIVQLWNLDLPLRKLDAEEQHGAILYTHFILSQIVRHCPALLVCSRWVPHH
jgi:hypothetical protein